MGFLSGLLSGVSSVAGGALTGMAIKDAMNLQNQPPVPAGKLNLPAPNETMSSRYQMLQGLSGQMPNGLLQRMMPSQAQAEPSQAPLAPQQNIGGNMADGISRAWLQRVAQIESGGNPRIVSPTGARGLYQFTERTWNDVGTGGDPFNPEDAERAMLKFTESNRRILQKRLKREPAPHELYMAHNLGAGGATRLLFANPQQKVSRKLIGSNPAHNPRYLMNADGSTITAGEAVRRYRASFTGI